MLAQILVIENSRLDRGLYSVALASEGYGVIQASDLREGRSILQRQAVHVLLLEVKLPDGNGLDFLSEVKKVSPDIEVILFTSGGSVDDGVLAIKGGAFDYIVKETGPAIMLDSVSRAARTAIDRLMVKLHGPTDSGIGLSGIIGESRAINKCRELARKVSRTNANVLLLGETGVGKDLFAEAIHSEGPRNGKPFLAINCSAIGREILESELFGYKAGAFTGATREKKGLFEMAHKGTIFLDEIGEMPIDLQARILRVLQNSSFIKLGDTRTTVVDCRIIAATNIDLQGAIRKGLFREDLYYRISSFTIVIPPLRERGNDINLIAEYLIRTLPAKLGMPVPVVAPTFIETLRAQPWKGNVRELTNVIERALIISDGILDETLLELRDAPERLAFHSLEEVEREHIKAVLIKCKGNKRAAARKLGIAIATLYRKLDDFMPDDGNGYAWGE